MPTKALIIWLVNLVTFSLCLCWYFKQPGFEPVVTALLIIAGGLLFPQHKRQVPISKSQVLSSRGTTEKIDVNAIFEGVGKKLDKIQLKQGDLLVIKGFLGTVAIELKFGFRSKASYKWRYAEKERGSIVSGEGVLFEQYGKNSRDGCLVTDLGGELFINAGPYKIEWSFRDFRSGWVYPKDANLDCYVLPSTALKSFRF